MGLKRILMFILVIILLGVFSVNYPRLTGDTIGQEQTEYPKEEAVLIKVTDGDTIHALVNGEDRTVRMLGINAPEKNMPLAAESAAFLGQFVNKTIYLQRDEEDEDKYHRKLRYVFAGDGMLNLELLELGLVNAYIMDNLAYGSDILRAEEQARNLKIGIWKKSSQECAQCITLDELNAKEEFFVIENTCEFQCELKGWFAKNSGRSSFFLDPMQAEEARIYKSEILNREVWNNEHDKFFIFDNNGELVYYSEY